MNNYLTIVHFSGACATLPLVSYEVAQRAFNKAVDSVDVVYARWFQVDEDGTGTVNFYANQDA